MEKLNRRNFIKAAGILPVGILACSEEDTSLFQESRTGYSVHDPWLEIDLKNIEQNIRQIKRFTSDRPVMAVLKCNAYGHGLVDVGKHLEKINIESIAVGKLQEALELRNAGIKSPLLNFGPFAAAESELIVKNDIIQSVYHDNVIALNDMAAKLGKQAAVHVWIDSGMGRVGVPYQYAMDFIENVSKLESIKIGGIFTAFTEDKEFDKVQLQRFLKLCNDAEERGIPVGIRHAASSAGVLGFQESHLDMVRPGICIYGHYPSDEEYRLKKIDLQPALSLKTRISYIKTLRPGESVSYHRKYTAGEEERIATLSLGYSDGIPVSIPGRAHALAGGKKFRVCADVTSNHTYVNLTGADNFGIGDEVVLFGRQGNSKIEAQELAKAADTSVYKILIWMNPKLRREFTG